MESVTCTSDRRDSADIAAILGHGNLSNRDMTALLSLREREHLDILYGAALALTRAQVGNAVYFRGIVEFSNRCEKNCRYCGIRSGNTKVERYSLTEEEIVECALWAEENRYGSLVLQSGERTSPEFTGMVERVVREIKRRTDLGITLCVGEQTDDVYRRFFDAGAHRYLLRIETSNPSLYESLHPRGHSFEKRRDCLRMLKKIGFQVGTGVMIGFPSQTVEDLARDILFFQKEEVDMIGMGPYIVHHDTPLATHETTAAWELRKEDILETALKMIAVTRLALKNVNIASTTALQALHPLGREMGLNAGANVVMPVITPERYRKSYLLYEGKPCIDDNASVCRDCLSGRVHAIGREVGWGAWGDSPHFLANTHT